MQIEGFLFTNERGDYIRSAHRKNLHRNLIEVGESKMSAAKFVFIYTRISF
jgi:hypothetical protein